MEHVAYRRDIIGDLRPNTAASYERLARIHVVAQLGATRLTKLAPGDVERACQRVLDEGLAPSSVATVVQVLRMMLDHAVREGTIVANPVARAQVPRQTREPATALATHDVDRILTATTGTTDAALWAMLALAGLRLGEGLGLAEDDVDLHARTVRVRRTLLHDRTFGPPKSDRGEREVPMLTSGVPIFLVSRCAGHATIQTTVDEYGHPLPGDDESARLIRETLDARFRGSG